MVILLSVCGVVASGVNCLTVLTPTPGSQLPIIRNLLKKNKKK